MLTSIRLGRPCPITAWLLTILLFVSGSNLLLAQVPSPQLAKISDWVPISFPTLETHYKSLPVDEQVEQLRDWALLAALLTIDQKGTAPRDTLYDLLPLRIDAFAPLAAGKAGITRSRSLNAQRLVALIPEDSEFRLNLLGRVADEHREVHGRIPTEVWVFEYRANRVEGTLSIRCTGSVPGPSLYTEKAGYFERIVSTTADLQAFLRATSDLVMVDMSKGELRLGGRAIPGRTNQITQQDIAVIYGKPTASLPTFLDRERDMTTGFSLDPRVDYKALAADIRRVLAKDAALMNWIRGEIRKEIELQPKQLPNISEMFKNGMALKSNSGKDGIGKSVPSFERNFLTLIGLEAPPLSDGADGSVESSSGRERHKREEEAKSDKLLDEEITAILSAASHNRDAFDQVINSLNNSNINPMYRLERYWRDDSMSRVGIAPGESGYMVRDIQDMLIENRLPLEATGLYGPETRAAVLDYQKQQGLETTGVVDSSTWASLLHDSPKKQQERLDLLGLLQSLEEKNKYQCARYEGPVQGTEVGMTMFYTDLLMKLWAFDWKESFPRSIPGFQPKTEIPVSPVYWADMREHPQTRSWLGARSESFAFSDDKKTLFISPLATRIFNASSDPLLPGKEVQANYRSERFASWWNLHYEEVADVEPQYHRLNQIQKWVGVLHWLRPMRVPVFEVLDLETEKHSTQFSGTWLSTRFDEPNQASGAQSKRQSFDAWLASHGIGWQGQLGFFSPAKLRDYEETTECIGLLQSNQFASEGSIHYLSGGVSTLSKAEIEKIFRSSPVRSLENAARNRPGLTPAGSAGGPPTFSLPGGRTAEFPEPNRARIIPPRNPDDPSHMTARPLRGADAAFTLAAVDVRVARMGDRVSVGMDVGGNNLLHIQAAKASGGIELSGGQGDLLAVARQLSKELNGIAEAPEGAQRVTSFEQIALPGGESLMRQTGGRWVLVSRDGIGPQPKGPRVQIGSDLFGRPYLRNTTLVSPAEIEARVRPYNWIAIDSIVGLGNEGAAGINLLKDGPSPGATKLQFKMPSGENIQVYIDEDGIFLPRGPGQLDSALAPAHKLIGTWGQSDLNTLQTVVDSTDSAFLMARRNQKGQVLLASSDMPIDPVLAERLSKILTANSEKIQALIWHETGDGQIQFNKGILEMNGPASEPVATRLNHLLEQTPQLAENLHRLGPISTEDIAKIESVPSTRRTGLVNMMAEADPPAGFAFFDTEFAPGESGIIVRSGNNIEYITDSSVTPDQIQKARNFLKDLYSGELKDAEKPTYEELQARVEPYSRLLKRAIDKSEAKRIVLKEIDAMPAELAHVLGGGDPSVELELDQPDMTASARNLQVRVQPSVGKSVVAATALLSNLDEQQFMEIRKKIDSIESRILEIEAPLTWAGFQKLLQDPKVTQITLIARSVDGGLVFSDRFVSAAFLSWELQRSKPKEYIHIISNGGGDLLSAFSGSGKFKRVIVSSFVLGDVTSVELSLQNVADIFEGFALPSALVRATDLQAEVARNPEIKEAIEQASESKEDNTLVSFTKLREKLRSGIGTATNMTDGFKRWLLERALQRAESPVANKELDALLTKTKTERYLQARSARRAEVDRIIRSIPRKKVDLQIPRFPWSKMERTGYEEIVRGD